jgi:hypothetical protein
MVIVITLNTTPKIENPPRIRETGLYFSSVQPDFNPLKHEIEHIMEPERKARGKDMVSRDAPDERIFFIVKYLILGCFESLFFLLTVLYLGSINIWQAVYIGLLLFFTPFIIGRYFEREIDWIALRVTNRLNRHPKIKRIIVRYM